MDIYSTKCPSIKKVKVLGHRRRIDILGVSPTDLDPSFYMMPTMKHTENSNCRTCKTLSSPRYMDIYGGKTCLLNSTKGELDSCPHYLQLNYDKHRIPPYIVQAKCSCEKCRITTLGGQTMLDPDGKCKPVEVYRQVLRKCQINKNDTKTTNNRTKREYIMRYEKYPVACTCKLASPNYGT